MRTSLNEIKEIEHYLIGQGSPENNLLFEAKRTLDPGLEQKIALQELAYEQIRLYARKQLRSEIALVENRLFNQSKYQRFRQGVLRLFKT